MHSCICRLWLLHHSVELALLTFFSKPLEKKLFWWLSVPAVTTACLVEQPTLMPIISLALFLTESDHLSINLKIATIFAVDIINLVCVCSFPILGFEASPLPCWPTPCFGTRKLLAKLGFFTKKHKVWAVCALLVSSLPGKGCLPLPLLSPVTDSLLTSSVGFGAPSWSALVWVDVEGGCSQADRSGGNTGCKDGSNRQMDVWV